MLLLTTRFAAAVMTGFLFLASGVIGQRSLVTTAFSLGSNPLASSIRVLHHHRVHSFQQQQVRHRSTLASLSKNADSNNNDNNNNQRIDNHDDNNDDSLCRHYIFGYGSLMSAHSRALTAPSLVGVPTLPVVVSHVEPVWAKRSSVIGMTAMGIRPTRTTTTTTTTNNQNNNNNNNNSMDNENISSAVGVLVPVSLDELYKFDVREKGYTRMALSLDQVSPAVVPQSLSSLQHHKNDASSSWSDYYHIFLDAKNNIGNNRDSPDNSASLLKLWTYVPDVFHPPDANHPILQSYVDTILRGCLEVGGSGVVVAAATAVGTEKDKEAFARQFIRSAKGWDHPAQGMDDEVVDKENVKKENDLPWSSSSSSSCCCYWINDREDPIYTRGDAAYSRAPADRLDRLLELCVPEAFAKRQLQPNRKAETTSNE